MKRIALVLFCALMSGSLLAQQAAPADPVAPSTPAASVPDPAPQIACDKPEFDFGQADSSQTIVHEYEIRNAGALTLEIKQIRPSCGCTVAEISQRTLKPGETAKIKASLNLSGRAGRQEKHIMVESNDPKTPMLMLGLRGDITQVFSLSPDRLTPGQVSGEVSAGWDIQFVNNSGKPVHVTKADTGSSNLVATVTETEVGKSYRVHVATAPPLHMGPMNATIRLHTDSTERPVFDVPFAAMVMGALVVAPPRILLAPQTTDPVTRYVILRPGSTKEFKVLKVEVPDPAMKVDQQAFGLGGVRIQINGIVAKPELKGQAIRITTDVETMKEVLVPFEITP